MLFFYNDETPVEWVIGQIEARGGQSIFGVVVEGQGLAFFKFRNGVAGLMVTGSSQFFQQGEALRSIGTGNRLIGSKGVIEVAVDHGPELRLRSEETGGKWQEVPLEKGGLHGAHLHKLAVLDLIDALKTGREPELAARKALQATELIFATYESSRRRGRVDLPLAVEDSPFQTMLNMGDITTWPDGYVTANGVRLHYWRTGDGSKPPLVLCHGFSDNGLCWTPLARALEADYDIIMYDARGHGLSDAPTTGYADGDRAADLAGLVQALGLKKPAVLGHSMGASTAAVAAALYPDLFSKVLLEEKRMSREALIAQLREHSPGWQEAELGPWAISKQQLSPNVLNRLWLKPRPWREVVAAITAPTLLITANNEKGGIVTPEIAAEAQELNPKIKVVHVPDVGHNIRREAFDTYVAAVREFLAE